MLAGSGTAIAKVVIVWRTMAFKFKNLDPELRQLMLTEVELDISNDSLYISKRFTPRGQAAYPGFLKEAVVNGTEASFGIVISKRGLINKEEMRHSNNKVITLRIPGDAGTSLAKGEFNRFYMRAVLVKAMAENLEVEIYRAQEVARARTESHLIIGKKVNSSELLENLRSKMGVDTALGLPKGPNSGLSIKLV
ncbi:MAG: hypothetical protein RLZZ230_364 [Candidatus Parcubacteria bacterium]|jgi:hypothetical protein